MRDDIEQQARDLEHAVLDADGDPHGWRILADALRAAEARGIERAAQKAEIHDPDIARRIRALVAEPAPKDCGDSACRYAAKRGGMRTNGGCRCDEPAREASGCPAIGVGGVHSEGFFDDSECQWCGEPAPKDPA